MDAPLIALKGVWREYVSGEDRLQVLKEIDLTIEAGEMVAIVGASGSGKSTLMNILGLLDRPSLGSYHIRGRATGSLDSNELAALRREHFGFIFQRYHLLGELTARDNVEVPAVYAGTERGARHGRASALLERLGMGARADHRPGQLSGGQQQRVSIARALMNGGEVILADEPTGALDSRSGEEVLRILEELNAEGRTVILVTHDPAVAARARRVIEISDGVITADRRREASPAPASEPVSAPTARTEWADAGKGSHLTALGEALRMALLAMNAHRMRAFLTMLGIIIGIASVVCVVALGEGSRQRVLTNISSLGTNTIEVFAGKSYGDVRSAKISTLVISDADALAGQPYVAAVTPTVSTSAVIRYRAVEANALVNGVGAQYFLAKGTHLAEGRLFGTDAVKRRTQEAVIDENTRTTLFGEGVSALGRVILVGSMPARIVGVTEPQQGGFGSNQNLSVYLPYTAVQTRLIGSQSLRSITVRVADDVSSGLAEQAVTDLLTRRHGSKDFFILNTDDIRRAITSTTQTMTVLIAVIAVISLAVGGIGVMNIMLVSVSERVGEIGVRMAVGARRRDILQQFLIEAVLVCLIGGVLGIALALAFGLVFAQVQTGFSLVYSATSIVTAVVCSTAIGVGFGYLPARRAARLDPVEALSRT
ncbi:MacB family efflux pump subunit [Ancylobacter pratisalsi]|uniref:Pyoverdine export ATP-binding/permease protein PvdT n=1 Tax=Ancylobacter pratisalsi TaxID=1745854 RepID=A0A6P1YLJ7_9HYPH|nr:MacB family efflux pump subunit [Ancylobacter pratisalsi]QIB34238.1 MacB family efflux pump subunit [Ancylobacter pratisalsi]